MFKRIKVLLLTIRIKFSSVFQFFERVDEHHLYLISAGIAFNILLYLIPLMLVAIYSVNLIFGVDKITNLIITTIDNLLPPNDTTIQLVQSTLKEINIVFNKSSVAGWIGFISLLWISSALLSSFRSGLNRIFEIKTEKIFFLYRLKDIGLILVMTLMLIISSYLLPLYSLVQQIVTTNLLPPYNWYFSKIFVISISLISSFIMFYILFRFLPDKRMPRYIVMMSTFMSVLITEISRNIFSVYVVKFANYGKFYGAYAVLVSLAFWVYYLTLIILISAEFSQFYYEKKQVKKESKLKSISPD